jgi:general stress protein YciG
MDPEEQRDIASRGGHSSRGGWGSDYEEEEDYEPSGRSRGGSRRGFAAMEPETRRRIASRGGRSSRRDC